MVASRQSRATMAANDHASLALPAKFALSFLVQRPGGPPAARASPAMALDSRSCRAISPPQFSLIQSLWDLFGRNRDVFWAIEGTKFERGTNAFPTGLYVPGRFILSQTSQN
jgi:hypothetical protein